MSRKQPTLKLTPGKLYWSSRTAAEALGVEHRTVNQIAVDWEEDTGEQIPVLEGCFRSRYLFTAAILESIHAFRLRRLEVKREIGWTWRKDRSKSHQPFRPKSKNAPVQVFGNQ